MGIRNAPFGSTQVLVATTTLFVVGADLSEGGER